MSEDVAIPNEIDAHDAVAMLRPGRDVLVLRDGQLYIRFDADPVTAVRGVSGAPPESVA